MPTEDEYKPVVIENWSDFADLDDGEESILDFEQDAFASVAPPPPGRYKVKLSFGKDSPMMKTLFDKTTKKPIRQYFAASIECEIISSDEDINGAKVFTNVSTLLGRGRGISTMAGLMVRGNKRPSSNKLSDKALTQEFYKWIESHPVMDCDVEWQLSYAKQDRKGNTVYINKYTKYSQFPIDSETGKKQFVFDIKISDDEIVKAYARLNVINWGSKTNDKKVLQSRRSHSNNKATDKELQELEEQFENA